MNRIETLLIKDSWNKEAIRQASFALALSQKFKKENPRRIIFTECFFYPQKPSFFEKSLEIRKTYGRKILQSNFEVYAKKINSSYSLPNASQKILDSTRIKITGQNPESVFYFVVNPESVNKENIFTLQLNNNVFFRLFYFLFHFRLGKDFKNLADIKAHLNLLLSNEDTAFKLVQDHFGLWFPDPPYVFGFTPEREKIVKFVLDADFPAKNFGIVKTEAGNLLIFQSLEKQKEQFKKAIELLKKLSEKNFRREKEFEKKLPLIKKSFKKFTKLV